jgi:hypothetical protein
VDEGGGLKTEEGDERDGGQERHLGVSRLFHVQTGLVAVFLSLTSTNAGGALSGNLALALDLTNKLLEIFPAHPRAVGNKEYYEDELQKGVTDKRKGDDGAAVADTDPVV